MFPEHSLIDLILPRIRGYLSIPAEPVTHGEDPLSWSQLCQTALALCSLLGKKKTTQKTEKQTFQSITSDCIQISEIENAFSSLDLSFLVGMQSRSRVRLCDPLDCT